jgi:hypothetical protein
MIGMDSRASSVMRYEEHRERGDAPGRKRGALSSRS